MTRVAGIAVFDLDHTLARCDSFLCYLVGFLVRHPWRIMRCLHLPVVIAKFSIGVVNNAKLKEAFLHAVMGGVRQPDIAAWNRVFLERLVRRGLRREGLVTLEAHRQAGDTLILLTASPDCYVSELGHRLGFDEVICTQVEWREGRLSGRLRSPNMRGEEKVRAIQDIRCRHDTRPITAYADHQSDLAMLRVVDRGVLVNGDHRTQAHAMRQQIQCVVWRD